MPGRFFLTRPTAEIATLLGVDGARIEDEPPRSNVCPGQDIVVLQPDGLTRMRWGILPVSRVNARGRPVMDTIINARSETVFQKSAFEGVRRCIVPVDGWYEWTGEKRKKTAWRIAPKDGGLLLFAAVADTWTGPGGIRVDQVASVTCEPNADVAPIHHRMGVIVPKAGVETWLNGSVEQASVLMKPLPPGLLKIAEASDVDWSAP